MPCRRTRKPWACGPSISGSLSADRPGPRARVHWVEHLGDQNHVHLKLATHSLVTLADPAQQLKAGDEVSLEFAEPLYFDQAGNRVGADGSRGHA